MKRLASALFAILGVISLLIGGYFTSSFAARTHTSDYSVQNISGVSWMLFAYSNKKDVDLMRARILRR